MQNFNTPAVAKLVRNKRLNTFRLLIAFATSSKQVNYKTCVYVSGDLNSLNDLDAAWASAQKQLCINTVYACNTHALSTHTERFLAGCLFGCM